MFSLSPARSRMPRAAQTRKAAAHYEEARRLVDRGRDAEASQRLDAALAVKPDFAEAFSLGGYILERAAKRDVALRFYQRAVSLRPDLPAAQFNLAKLLIREGRFGEALATL